MVLKYVLKDDKGHSGQSLPITQGQTSSISLFLFNDDGTPYVWSGSLGSVLAKIFSGISQAPIMKSVALSSLTEITSSQLSGAFGVQFVLSATDTQSMAANNNGVPMTLTFTDSGGAVTEIDIPQAFSVSAPLIP